jgi:tetratricopeptide (TPR) repeat protein
MKNIFIGILFIFIFAGCAQKVTVTSIEPALIERASEVKKLSVLNFSKDNIGFASKLETQLSKKQFFGESYFTVLNRSEIDTILEEQRLQYSGLVDKNTSVKIGKILGVQGIVSGEISDASVNKSYYRSPRTRCLDKKCKEYRVYYVSCTKANYNLTISLKLTDVQYGDIIYADTISKNTAYSHCQDRSGGLPTFGYVMDKMSDNVVIGFVSKLSPNKRVMEIELLDDPEIDYSDEQEEILEYSLEYIQNERLDKAEELLAKLLTSTNDKCYVAAYNLGLIKEAQGEYKLAKQLYDLADNLVLKPNKVLDRSIIRINKQIKNKQLVDEQLGN